MKIYTDNYPNLSECSTEDLISISEFHKVILNYLKMNKIIKTKTARNLKNGDKIEMQTMDGAKTLTVKSVKVLSEEQKDLLIIFEDRYNFHALPDEEIELAN